MIEQAYLDSVIKRFTEYKTLGDKTLAQLTEEQLYWLANESSNNIAVIIQHLHGNMLSRWTDFLTADGEKPWRNRDEEFELHALSREQLLNLWEEGWQLVLTTLSSLTIDQLSQHVTIRSEQLTVVDAINRQLAHYSYHIGQMVFISKWILQGNWQTLSIPKGHSKDFNDQMTKKNKF